MVAARALAVVGALLLLAWATPWALRALGLVPTDMDEAVVWVFTGLGVGPALLLLDYAVRG